MAKDEVKEAANAKAEDNAVATVAAPEKPHAQEACMKAMAPADIANGHIRTYMLLAAGAGFIPVTGVDLAGIAAVQVKLVDAIAKAYGVPFKQTAAKAVVMGLLGSVGVARLFGAATASLLKVVPGVGQALASFTLPSLAAASTYALGKVFIQHFETGGTLLDFNAKEIQDHYVKLMDEGKLEAKKLDVDAAAAKN